MNEDKKWWFESNQQKSEPNQPKSYQEMSRDELVEAKSRLEAALNPEISGLWDEVSQEGIRKKLEQVESELAARPEGDIKLD